MKIHILPDAEALGKAAAEHAARLLRFFIAKNKTARLLLSTGMSQFETIEHLKSQDVDWSCVEVFHLDEYIGLPKSHPASFRKYLEERFVTKVQLKSFYPVDGEGDVIPVIRSLNEQILQAPIDVGLIGIGENAHIAFNDPPADFETDEPYIIVSLDEKCRMQQVREGWFPDAGSVPKQAISMSVRQILRCSNIISSVPHAVKAEAVRLALEEPVSNRIPASILRTHASFDIYLDQESSAALAGRL
ncbi:MAG: glucosamine-6-phosphate deaminase [Saccharofermentanales bacterium]